MGASFGAGASNTVFGSSGSTPFLVKITILFAVFYFANSLGIGYITTQHKKLGVNVSPLLTPQLVEPVTPPPASQDQVDNQALNAALRTAQQATVKNIQKASNQKRQVGS